MGPMVQSEKQHYNQPVNSHTFNDINYGEKPVMGGEMGKGHPTENGQIGKLRQEKKYNRNASETPSLVARHYYDIG